MIYDELVAIISSEGELITGPDSYKIGQVRENQFYWPIAESPLNDVKFTFVDGKLTRK